METNNPEYGTERALTSIANERKRQVVVEGFSRLNDDKAAAGSIALAASCYARFASLVLAHDAAVAAGEKVPHVARAPHALWPWSQNWWKPKTPREDLVRAAALIVAQIEVLDRARSEFVRPYIERALELEPGMRHNTLEDLREDIEAGSAPADAELLAKASAYQSIGGGEFWYTKDAVLGMLREVAGVSQRVGGVSRVFRICNAYESGMGHGLQRDELPNPYAVGTEDHEAYDVGYKEGADRAPHPPSPQPGHRDVRLPDGSEMRIHATQAEAQAFADSVSPRKE